MATRRVTASARQARPASGPCAATTSTTAAAAGATSPPATARSGSRRRSARRVLAARRLRIGPPGPLTRAARGSTFGPRGPDLHLATSAPIGAPPVIDEALWEDRLAPAVD